MTSLSDEQLDRLRSLVDWPDTSGTRYELLGKIAVGGMGSVYKAHDRLLDRPVAFKVLTVADSGGRLAERMMAEAKIVARLEHPSIVPIHEVGRLADGRVFYAMKFVEGKTLDAMRKDEPLPVLLRLFQKICDGVEFAHSRGVVHRDLKPSNVMVGAFGEVLVMDWGVATSSLVRHGRGGPEDESAGEIFQTPSPGAPVVQTEAGTIIGTPAYMSPEAASGRSHELDHRTDVYGLGGILFFLLTGEAPRIANPAGGARVAVGEVPSVREKVPQLHRRLAAICDRALAVLPEDRYASARGLSEDITRYLDHQPVVAYRESIFERASRWLGRNRLIVWMVLAYIIFRFLVFFWRGI